MDFTINSKKVKITFSTIALWNIKKKKHEKTTLNSVVKFSTSLRKFVISSEIFEFNCLETKKKTTLFLKLDNKTYRWLFESYGEKLFHALAHYKNTWRDKTGWKKKLDNFFNLLSLKENLSAFRYIIKGGDIIVT